RRGAGAPAEVGPELEAVSEAFPAPPQYVKLRITSTAKESTPSARRLIRGRARKRLRARAAADSKLLWFIAVRPPAGGSGREERRSSRLLGISRARPADRGLGSAWRPKAGGWLFPGGRGRSPPGGSRGSPVAGSSRRAG